MKSRNIKAALTISLPSGGPSERVCIRIRDNASRNTFVTVEVPLADFTRVLMGLAEVHVTASIQGLKVVGKRKVIEMRSVECPLSSGTSKEDYTRWLIANAQEDGWILDPHLGSQHSVTRSENGNPVLNYRVFKYVKE